QSVDLPQHDGCLLIKRKPVERGSNLFRKLLLSDEPIRPMVDRFRQLAVILDVLIQGHLLRAVAPPPPALPVARLVDDDAVNPRPQATMAPEGLDRAEDAQENLLRQVERFVVVVEKIEGKLINHSLVLGD